MKATSLTPRRISPRSLQRASGSTTRLLQRLLPGRGALPSISDSYAVDATSTRPHDEHVLSDHDSGDEPDHISPRRASAAGVTIFVVVDGRPQSVPLPAACLASLAHVYGEVARALQQPTPVEVWCHVCCIHDQCSCGVRAGRCERWSS